MLGSSVILAGLLASMATAQCPDYSDFSKQRHSPFSSGKYKLSYMRPDPSCRTFKSQVVDDVISKMNSTIKDPDLYRLFQNSFPNTLDTAIKWKGVAANNSAEELTFIITGDINAMWLRDSANQMQSYKPLLKASTSNNSIASLYRGVINLQSRYLLTSPYCNSFQAPPESGILPADNSAADSDAVTPPYSKDSVFECKYELDSLAAFLEVSTNYYEATRDLSFFKKFQWVPAVKNVLKVAQAMMVPTYASDGKVNTVPYTFQRQTNAGTETLTNSGKGNPVGAGTGLVRSAFRPSDDATIYQLFIPANMMFSHYLGTAAAIMQGIGQSDVASQMKKLSSSIAAAIKTHGVVKHPTAGSIYAFEVDGYGSQNIMDDANIPSLLSAPFIGFTNSSDPIYQATRKLVLSSGNSYFMRGPVINAVGGPHAGFGHAWPMASIVRILTSDDDKEITQALKEIVSSTDGLGLIHESINTFDQSDWTRQWFSWANGLFGQMILDLNDRKPNILKQSFQ